MGMFGDVAGGAGAGAAFGPYGALAGAGLGLGNYFLFDKPEQAKQQRIAQAQELGSPWTGQHGKYTETPNPIGSVYKGGLAGADYGQKLQEQADKQKLNQAIIDSLSKKDNVAPQTMGTAQMSPYFANNYVSSGPWGGST